MSLESFGGFETGEVSESALEELRERMKAAAAQIAAIRREEQKRKKKEGELVQILLRFIQTSHKSDLVLLISRALEQDIPANFILAIVILGNEDIQEATGDFLALPPGMLEKAAASDKALTFFNQKDESMPLKVRIELDFWLKGVMAQAEETPHKLIEKAYAIEYEKDQDSVGMGRTKYIEKKVFKDILGRLAAFVIFDFLKQNDINEDFEKISNFANFVIKGIVDKTAEGLANRNLLN
jgi:hypothetical protein